MATLTSITQPLREEHGRFLPHIEQLRVVADSIGEVPVDSLQQAVDRIHAFLVHDFIPYLRAEDCTLYPMVDQVLGAPEATAVLSRDHAEIIRLTQELGTVRGRISDSQAKALRRILYGLYTLVPLALDKEETIYMPLMHMWLTVPEAHAIVSALDEADKEMRVCPLD